MIERSAQSHDERTTLVVGLGKTGLSCVRHLRGLGRRVAAVDSRAEPPSLETIAEEFPEVPVTVGGFSARAFEGVAEIVVSPGVSLSEPALERALAEHIPVHGDIELFARAVGVTPVAAITGSNGKSTVTTMVAEMLRGDGRRVKVGGNLGEPALALLDGERPEVYVLELSSFQLESTQSLRPRVAALLNVSADHMDRYPDVDAYARAKARIFAGHGAMVLNRDDARVAALARRGREVIFYTLATPEREEFGVRRVDDREHLCLGDTPIVAADALALAGSHNVANALAAMAVASVLGVSHRAMARTLESFRALPHRCELVAEADGVRWYDDSKATNVGAACASIRGLGRDGSLVLIAGGDAKDADFSALVGPLRDHVRVAVLVGRDAARIAEVAEEVVEVRRAGDMAQAVEVAREVARAGESVLLAPACASFDMFTDFAARGDAFVAEVRRALGR